jgi:transposase InsO family protein
MEDSKSAVLKRLQELKTQTRSHDIKLKLNLFLKAIKLGNVAEACSRMGMGRTFYYKWWKRLNESGFQLESLNEHSRRPKTSPNQTSKEIENKIFDLKILSHGALMIHGVLLRENIKVSVPTISHILNERKEISRKERKRLNPHNKRYELPIPGQRLQMDVKYVPHKVEGKKAYTYVAIDECTRWRFAYAFDSLDQGTTVKFLNMLKEACPFPIACIQTDNGFEFTYRLTPHMKDYVHLMSQWCSDNNVVHRCIPPGVKELNGKVERSHRIDEQYFYWKAPDKCLRTFNEKLTEWLNYYNEERPHYGINFLTPVEKLQERLLNVRQEVLAKDIEWIRNQFLIEAPVKVFKRYGGYNLKIAA